MRLLKFSILFVLLAGFGLHEYYVSIFRLTYNSTQKQIKGELKVFSDDLENLLKTNGYGTFALEDVSQKEKIEAALSTELKKNFSYTDKKQNTKDIELVGFEYQEDLTWIYFTVNKVKFIETPQLYINWMVDLFPGQVNIVHLDRGDEERSEFFSKDKPTINFVFSE